MNYEGIAVPLAIHANDLISPLKLKNLLTFYSDSTRRIVTPITRPTISASRG